MDKNEKKKLLDDLRLKMQKDYSLPLRKGAKNLVFGVGNPETQILFIGEGPGYHEDQRAEPFVGNAGQLLNQLLHSIELDRSNVYITNVVHHRPPDNRDPQPDEIKAYEPYLDGILEIINPKLIVSLGRFSMGKFLPYAKITSVHGKLFRVNWKGKEIAVIPMFHPAAGLRSEEVKRKMYEDFEKLAEILKDIKEEAVKSEQMQLV